MPCARLGFWVWGVFSSSGALQICSNIWALLKAGRGLGLKQGVVSAIGAEGTGMSNGEPRSIGVQPWSLKKAREGRLV